MAKKRTARKVRLDPLLGGSETPVYLLDHQRRIVFFNAGCERLTGWAMGEVLGEVCEYRSTAEAGNVESITGALCPPPEVFEGRFSSRPAFVPHRGGGSAERMLSFFPLLDDEGKVKQVLAVVGPLERPAGRATRHADVHTDLAALRLELRRRYGRETVVARSEPMRRVLEQVNVAVATQSPVLFVGPRGSGKEHLARLIHYESGRSGQAFVPLDCARTTGFELKRTVSRLVGRHDGADVRVVGLQPGTLFLRHVERLPHDLQQQIAEAFREAPRESRSLRLMASTHGDPEEQFERELYRPDFYYLITALEIRVPPLADRPEDLEPLAQQFLEEGNRDPDGQLSGFDAAVWDLFRRHNWPGNVGELEAVVEEARAAATGTIVREEDLPFRFRTALDAQSVGPRKPPRLEHLEPLLERLEAEHLRTALEAAGQNKSQAAELLGISRARLHRRMKALGLADGQNDHTPDDD